MRRDARSDVGRAPRHRARAAALGLIVVRPNALRCARRVPTTRALPRAPTGARRRRGRHTVIVALATAAVASAPRGTLVGWNGRWRIFPRRPAFAATVLLVGNRELTVPLYRTVLNFTYTTNQTDDDRAWELIPQFERGGDLPFTALTAAFFLLSALFHTLNATLLRGYYLRMLADCYTPTRWIEYSLSAPVHFALVAYAMGVRDRALLIALCTLVAVTMPFGAWVEVHARPATPYAGARRCGGGCSRGPSATCRSSRRGDSSSCSSTPGRTPRTGRPRSCTPSCGRSSSSLQLPAPPRSGRSSARRAASTAVRSCSRCSRWPPARRLGRILIANVLMLSRSRTSTTLSGALRATEEGPPTLRRALGQHHARQHEAGRRRRGRRAHIVQHESRPSRRRRSAG